MSIRFNWDPDKNERLIEQRGVSFESVVVALNAGEILDVFEHPNQDRYPGQRIYVVNINDYAHLVPYERKNEEITLKTIIPSRKATRRYLKRAQVDE